MAPYSPYGHTMQTGFMSVDLGSNTTWSTNYYDGLYVQNLPLSPKETVSMKKFNKQRLDSISDEKRKRNYRRNV